MEHAGKTLVERMLIYRAGGSLPTLRRGVALGNFDGVHVGHQALFSCLHHDSEVEEVMAILFWPHPREFFGETLPRIYRLTEQLKVLSAYVHAVMIVPFNEAFRQKTPEEFIAQLQDWGAVTVAVGEDYRFGHQRLGDVQTLKQAAKEKGYRVHVCEPLLYEGEVISSTRLRATLMKGDFELAAHLLGRRYVLWGRVCHGQGIAGEWGFPTANLRLGGGERALDGVYGAWVHGLYQSYPAAVSVGRRESMGGGFPILEAHLWGFEGDCYGEHLQVDFQFLWRKQEKFSDITQLKQQIYTDIVQIAKRLGGESPWE